MTARHRWNLTPHQAVVLQEKLGKEVNISSPLKSFRLVGGADVAYDQKERFLCGAIVVLSYPELETVEEAWTLGKVGFPYIPGLFSFREGPVILAAMKKIRQWPDVLIFDGQGIAHPRGMGIASHLGLFLEMPTVGCAKTKLVGEHGKVARPRGSWVGLNFDGRRVGVVLRTQSGVRPVVVSPGHHIDIKSAMQVVLATAVRYRLPEPTRQAHILVHRIRRECEGS